MRFRDAVRAFPRMGPYLLSHHPHCAYFRADVALLRGRRLCIACFVGYPALAAAAAAVLAWGGALPWWAWVAGGLVAATPQASSFLGRVPGPRTQVAVKLALGAGFGAVLGGLVQAPWPWPARAAATLATFTLLQSLWLLRLVRLDRTCARCPERAVRPLCSGLADLHRRTGAVLSLPAPMATALTPAQAPGGPRLRVEKP
jgi:hypothetical protein